MWTTGQVMFPNPQPSVLTCTSPLWTAVWRGILFSPSFMLSTTSLVYPAFSAEKKYKLCGICWKTYNHIRNLHKVTCVFGFVKSKYCATKGIFHLNVVSLSVIFWKITTHNAAIELLVFCLLCRQKRCVSASFRVDTVCTCLFHCPTTITEINLIVSVQGNERKFVIVENIKSQEIWRDHQFH